MNNPVRCGARVDGGGVGALLRIHRRAAGLSQDDLAGRSGLSTKTIRNIEGGRIRWPHPDTVRRLADALRLSVEQRQRFIVSAARRLAPAAADSVASPPEDGLPGRDRRHIVPRQLPAPARHFVGRQAELAALDDLLARTGTGALSAVVIAAIDGSAGVGKTALTMQWAHQVAERFPDGQLYLNLRGFDPIGEPTSAAAAIRSFLDALHVPLPRIPVNLEAQISLYRSLVAGKRMLVVLDNARDANQVRPLLPGSPGSLVIITSRSHLTGLVAVEGAYPLTLGLLTDAEARELLVSRLGRARAAAESEAVDELVRLCARLPLALTIAAARTWRPDFPLAAFTAELRDGQTLLDMLDVGDAAASVRAAFSCSYQNLTGRAAWMFRLLSVNPGPDISAAAASKLADLSSHEACQLLGELVDAHLLVQRPEGRFAFHDLLRVYAIEAGRVQGSDAERQEALRRVLDYYSRNAYEA